MQGILGVMYGQLHPFMGLSYLSILQAHGVNYILLKMGSFVGHWNTYKKCR